MVTNKTVWRNERNPKTVERTTPVMVPPIKYFDFSNASLNIRPPSIDSEVCTSERLPLQGATNMLQRTLYHIFRKMERYSSIEYVYLFCKIFYKKLKTRETL